ncbi:CoA transferase [Bradyrhizobium sp. CW1]|uniref:CoA transferase n=1 Tax=Bradyrhizobium sp. CW1 TaxID=2782686 RepID=UPI001FFFA359|nr:CoA transferase [Bradyrhizobium sp. CW1]UPJ26319.1 CoA transferase [Bradyrhizobium sp. CW1]
MPPSTLPLFGVKVVDFGQYIAGPAVAMILADLGATVVHIDPPSGPLWDSPANATLNRNKLIVSIDLKTEEGLSRAHTLIADADIVIENFRPGVLSRLGVDFSSLRKTRPALTTVSIPGFASNDQLRREWRAFEAVIGASSGLFTDMGLNRVLRGIDPSFSPLPLASAYGTMLAVSAALLALQARERSGVGDQIEVPLACAVMEGLAYNSISIDQLPLRYKSPREREIARRRESGLPMNLSYQETQELLDPFARNYKCKDGRMFFVLCSAHKHHTRRCLQVLGLYDELLAEGLVEEMNTYLSMRDWRSDISLSSSPLPKSWADKIAGRMKTVFLTRTAAEWEDIFGERRIPAAPQRWLQEWIRDDHAERAGLMIKVDDPVYGRMTQPGPVAWLEESGEVMLNPAPRRWVAFDQAVAAFSSLPVRQLSARKADRSAGWLDGVRVLDLSNVIAGPHSGCYLARFGAEVIKLDPASPLFDSSITVIYGMTHMRGKRSVLLDIESSPGRKVFERLVKSVDVVIWNATDRQVERVGLDPQSLKSLNPDAIFCQLDCFGGIRRGPRSDYLGYENHVQATTGIMLRSGGSDETPEEYAHVGTIDVMGGFSAALGVAAALYQKARTGRAGRARTSLSALAGLLQIPFCYDYAGRGPFDEPAGINSKGYDALNRFYTASDRSLLLSASERDLPRLEGVARLQGVADVPKEELTAFLAHAIAKDSAENWISAFNTAGVGAAICESIAAIRSGHSRLADGAPGTEQGSYAFSIFRDHPSGHVLTQVDHYAVRSTVGKVYALPPAEQYGASTRQVLQKLQYRDSEIDALSGAKVVSEGWSTDYLPS